MERLLQERYNIFIGLKDKDTKEQKMSKEAFIELINKICKNENVEFSVITMNGGYIHYSGDYILENSLQLSLGGISEEKALGIANSLKQLLNQECVIITREIVNTYILK